MAVDVIKRAKLRDSALVCVILLAQAALPIVVIFLRPEHSKFKSANVAVASQLCLFVSFPLLLYSAIDLTILSHTGEDIDQDLITPLSCTSSQLQRLQYPQGSIALACSFQAAAGLIWILEARQHPNSLVLILLAATSSALLGVLVERAVRSMRTIERMKTKAMNGKQVLKPQLIVEPSAHF